MLRVRTVFTGTIPGVPYLSTMYFTASDTQAGADAAVAAVGAFWGAVDNVMTQSLAWATQDEVLVMDNSGQATGVFTTTPQTGVGSLSTPEPLPPSNQVLIRWQTAGFIAGKRLVGRTFVPGLTEAANNFGNVLAATRTTIDTAAEALVAATADLAIWSRTNSLSFPATSASVNTAFAVLRSRRD